MNVLRNLTGTPCEENWREPGVRHHMVLDESVRGYARAIKLGPAGVIVTDGKASVVIPLEEIYALAEAMDPALKPPKGPIMKEIAPPAQ